MQNRRIFIPDFTVQKFRVTFLAVEQNTFFYVARNYPSEIIRRIASE